MSDNHDSVPPELQPTQPEPDAAAEPAAPLRKPRRTAIIAAVAGAAALLLIVGGGAWAFTTLVLGKGQSAAASAAAFPKSTVGWAEFAIDPSNDQKLAALDFTNNLPGLEDALAATGIDLDLSGGADTDLKKTAWKAFVSALGESKTSLDYDNDIKPWLGSRVAVGLLPNNGSNESQIMIAIESSDDSAAKKSLTTLLAEQDDAAGWTVGAHGGYALLGSEGVDLNEVFRTGLLEDNPEFASAASKSGDWGLVSGWTGPGFAAEVSRVSSSDGTSADSALAAVQGGSQFAVVRIVDGALELSGTSTGIESGPELGDAGSAVSSLPASTMLAGSAGSLGVMLDYILSDNDLGAVAAEAYGSALGADPAASSEEQIAAARATVTDFFSTSFGLTFPEDVDSLFGESLTVVLDGNVSLDTLSTSTDPYADIIGSGLAVVVTSTDAEATGKQWDTVLGTATEQLGADLGLTATVASDRVVIGAGSYAEVLAGPAGNLGTSEQGALVLPDLDGASGVFYLDIPAALATIEDISNTFGGTAADTAALEGLGAIGATSTRVSDTESSYRIRLSTISK